MTNKIVSKEEERLAVLRSLCERELAEIEKETGEVLKAKTIAEIEKREEDTENPYEAYEDEEDRAVRVDWGLSELREQERMLRELIDDSQTMKWKEFKQKIIAQKKVKVLRKETIDKVIREIRK